MMMMSHILRLQLQVDGEQDIEFEQQGTLTLS